MIDFESYKKPNGDIDWGAYHKAQARAGELCRTCGGIIIFGSGHPDDCGDCKAMSRSEGEVRHHNNIRCPKCRRSISVSGGDLDELYAEGEHPVTCPTCDHEFVVSTMVTHYFTSPALLGEPKDAESEEEPSDE